MTLRKLFTDLIDFMWESEAQVKVRLIRRGQDMTATHEALIPISRIGHNHRSPNAKITLCCEELEIHWEPIT